MKKLLKLCFNTSEWSPTRSDWLRLISSLPKSERDRILSFAFKRDSKNSLIGQILIRICIRRLLPRVDWPNLVIDRNQKGRPCLKLKETLQLSNITDFGHNIIDVNISHSGDLCAVVAGIRPPAKCSENWLGVDCMKIEVDNKTKTAQTGNEANVYEIELAKHERVIRSRFSSSEKSFINSSVNPAEKLAAFYRLWCLKESYGKATGLGMSGLDPSKQEFQIINQLMIDPDKKNQFIVNNTKLLVSGKIKKECKFFEQYWIPAVKQLDLHIITVCLIDPDDDKYGKWECEEFLEVSAKDFMDEFVKSNPNLKLDESNSTLMKELDDLWTNFSKKL